MLEDVKAASHSPTAETTVENVSNFLSLLGFEQASVSSMSVFCDQVYSSFDIVSIFESNSVVYKVVLRLCV